MYFLAIVLPSNLNEKVAHWKHYMLQHYQCKVALKSPAHITLLPPFWMEEDKENEFSKDVAAIAGELHPFTLRTNNFSAFKPRTIFIDLQPNEELNKAKKKVDGFFEPKQNYPVKIDRRPFHPHITIATRDLFKKSFYEAWPLFEKETFQEEWLADSISILRHNKKNWEVLQASQFQSI